MVFNLGPLVIQAKWAKSWSWFDRTKNCKVHSLISITVVEFDEFEKPLYGIRIILLPVSIMVGMAFTKRHGAGE